MIYLKKLIFAPIFLLSFALLLYLINPIFKSYDFILALSVTTLIQFLSLSILIILSSLIFVLFATFSQDWRLILPVGVLGSIIPFIIFDPSLGLVLSVGTFSAILVVFLILEGKLKSYLTFEPTSLLGPSIRHLSTFLIIVISIAYFLSVNKLIQTEGFQIPDSLIDTALKFTSPNQELTQLDQGTKPKTPTLTQEQIELLRQNPALLEQYALDPSILDNLPQSASSQTQPLSGAAGSTQDLIKQTIKDQIQKMVDPYLMFIPASLAGLLFLTLLSLTSFLNLLIYPLLWIIFFILEKTGFVKFTTEMRPVKKMMV